MTAKRIALALAVAALVLSACASLATKRARRAMEHAYAAQNAGDWEAAARYADEAQASLPKGDTTSPFALDIQGERGRIARRAGLDDEAERHFEELRDRIERKWPGTPSVDYALFELAQLRLQRGDRDGARELWERIVALEGYGRRAGDDYRAFAYAGLARLARDAGDTAEADRLFRLAITQGGRTTGPAFADVRTEYGALLRSLGRVEDAERVEAGVGAPLRARHYLWYVVDKHPGLDPFDERVVRRWPDEAMPLRVYLPAVPAGAFPGQDPAAVRAVVVAGALAWRDVVRPGVPSFVFVDSAFGADLRFRWTAQRDDTLVGETRAPKTKAFRPSSIRLATQWHPRAAAPLAGLRCTAEHETGHALGLWGHSPDPGDLMYPGYVQAGGGACQSLGERDKETLRLLYSFAPRSTITRADLP